MNLTDEERRLQLPATCFIVYRTDYIFALKRALKRFSFFLFNGLMINLLMLFILQFAVFLVLLLL